ncbi:MAG: hypothetical protein ACREH6_09890 [Geminicoccaceae bacterium]
MHEPLRRTSSSVWSNPSRKFFLLLTLFPIGFGVAGVLGFTDTAQGAFVALVSCFFVIVFVAIPWLLSRLLTRDDRQKPAEDQEGVGPLGWLQGRLDTATERLEARQFAIQVLIVPVAAVVGMIAIGAVFSLVA